MWNGNVLGTKKLFDYSIPVLVDMPQGRVASYYNPRCRIEMKNGVL
jgi:hypothetical protein